MRELVCVVIILRPERREGNSIATADVDEDLAASLIYSLNYKADVRDDCV